MKSIWIKHECAERGAWRWRRVQEDSERRALVSYSQQAIIPSKSELLSSALGEIDARGRVAGGAISLYTVFDVLCSANYGALQTNRAERTRLAVSVVQPAASSDWLRARVDGKLYVKFAEGLFFDGRYFVRPLPDSLERVTFASLTSYIESLRFSGRAQDEEVVRDSEHVDDSRTLNSESSYMIEDSDEEMFLSTDEEGGGFICGDDEVEYESGEDELSAAERSRRRRKARVYISDSAGSESEDESEDEVSQRNMSASPSSEVLVVEPTPQNSPRNDPREDTPHSEMFSRMSSPMLLEDYLARPRSRPLSTEPTNDVNTEVTVTQKRSRTEAGGKLRNAGSPTLQRPPLA